MKKILFVVSSLRVCGPINQLRGIVSNLDSETFEYKILTLSEEPEHSMKPQFDKLGVSIDSLSLSRTQFLLKGKSTLKKYIENYDPDVIHTTGVRVDTAVSNIGYEHKQVMSIRNYAYDDYVAKFGKVVGTFFARNTIKAIENVKAPVCCSYSLKEMYQKDVNVELKVVQNGVDINRFYPLHSFEEKIELRKKLNLPEGKLLFIVIGSLIKRKDPLTVIRAFKHAQIDNAQLLILGEGNLKEECEKEADHSISFFGNVTNVVEYLNASDAYVSASLSEGLPNSVLEAGRTGIDLILSDIPQHREVFLHGKDYARYFSTKDGQGLSSLLIDKGIKRNQEINMSLAEYIADHYSNQSMSKKYQQIYLTDFNSSNIK